jgi:hypothetical protein
LVVEGGDLVAAGAEQGQRHVLNAGAGHGGCASCHHYAFLTRRHTNLHDDRLIMCYGEIERACARPVDASICGPTGRQGNRQGVCLLTRRAIENGIPPSRSRWRYQSCEESE